ncbi:histidine kinase famiy protein [uncultured Xylophilus sp.]|uniref:histidine kinase famiy protein n=1 Tax=uncultured Xylophilus sp. TaxID=296832 RepID=UPI0025DFBFDE|nr:histidine kinase famiy protein [uncultured Xylophilus sp.]
MDIQEKPHIPGRSPEVSDAAAMPSSLQEPRDDMFFAAIETTRMPMLVTDPRQHDNPIVFANRAFTSMTGYGVEELLGQNCRFLQGAETDRTTVAAIREAISERREITVEILNYRKDGSTFWNALFVSPVYNHRRELVYFFASQLDVSRRRDAEAALSHAQRMESLGQLTGGISHDFNNLLQVMSGHVDMLQARIARDSLTNEVAQRSLGHIRTAIGKASSLTQQLLSFSRKQRLDGRTVNLNKLIESLSSMVDRALGDNVQISTVLAPDLENCKLDTTQLELALLNILVNARDAMPDGGSVVIKTHNQYIGPEDVTSFSGLQPGHYVAISVTDTGCGIPPEMISRVMEPFFSTKEEGKGTGLGLSMVHGFAKQSGGAATIYSEVDLGTTVRLYFPVSKDGVKRDTPDNVRPRERGGSETILVVDDRPEVAELARDMLEGLGYQVHMAHTGQQALSVLDHLLPEQAPQLLFSDVIMPGGMNGFALAREVQRRVPGIHVLLTTGYAANELELETTKDSAFDVLKKPYRLGDLARKVRMVLDGVTGAA